MGTQLDLDDVAAASPLAQRQLLELRADVERLTRCSALTAEALRELERYQYAGATLLLRQAAATMTPDARMNGKLSGDGHAVGPRRRCFAERAGTEASTRTAEPE